MDRQQAHEKVLRVTLREMKLKTTMRNHLMSARKPHIQTLETSGICGVVVNKESSPIVGGNVIWSSGISYGL